jgi:5-(carboxyamino)imidazole ribonucleotide synthase
MSIAPGGTIGILGGGQLGRMLGLAAAQLGYRVHIYAPGASGPASEVAWRWTLGAYDDADALRAFAAEVDVVTYEFENIEAKPLDGVANIAPGVRALDVAQDRLAEKRFCESVGGRPAQYRAVDSRAELDAALAAIGTPAVLKTRRFGYDGKGQARLRSPADADVAWDAIGGQPAILEAMVAFDHEFSILLARGRDGAMVRWDAVENVHEDGILRTSTVPASPEIAAQFDEAADLAARIAAELDYVGVLACEFFASADGPVFNEMAPRVHNSGHWTIEGAVTSQFENHIRAICGLPLGATGLSNQGAQMRNLIGYEAGEWAQILADPAAHLHLYGKSDPRPGRKMGHVTKVY